MPHTQASPIARVSFITMGCAKNEVDSARMRARLLDSDYEIIDDPEQADAVIVNTCSFIQAATEESIDAILEVAGYENVASSQAKLIVAGCMPSRYGADLEAELVEAGAFVPCADEGNIVSILDGLFHVDRSILPDQGYQSISPTEAAPVSAYVKISDGCDRFCAYCSIPYIRGRYHSFTYAEIEANVADLVSRGSKEIVLIAQDTGRWGNDFEEPSTLAHLMGALAEAFPDTWFRVMYIQPEGVTDDLIETVATHDNICNYFDLPFQHVNPTILKSMNRKGSAEAYNQLIERIRTRIPDVAIRTTLIAGYPGETEDQFDELCDFVEEADLDYIGVFAYSREEGTHAFDLPNQVDEDEKAERAQRLRDLCDDVCTPRIASRIDKRMSVLVCGEEEDGQLYGRAMCQAPDVDGVTYVSRGQVGDIIEVTISNTLLYEMEGE